MVREVFSGPDGPITAEVSEGGVWFPAPQRAAGDVGPNRCRSIGLSVRMAGDRKRTRVIYGYASVFDEWGTVEDRPGLIHREIIKPGAFRTALAERQEVVCVYNHDSSRVLGETKLGTLRLREDARGLQFECDVPDDDFGRSIVSKVDQGKVSGASFKYFPREGGESKRVSSLGGRTLIESTITAADLFDVSVVDRPVYRGTSAKARGVAIVDPAERRRREQREAYMQGVREKLRQLDTTRAGWSSSKGVSRGRPTGGYGGR